MSDQHDHPAGDDEEQPQEESFEKMLDEIVTKYAETLRRLGES